MSWRSLLDDAGVSVVVDHHASNPGFGDVRLVDGGAPATVTLVAGILDDLGVTLDEQLATCLYAGLSADTGSFRFGNTRPDTHELAARLLSTGIDHSEISRRLFDTAPFGWLGLLSAVTGRAVLEPEVGDGGLVWTWSSTAEAAEYGLPGEQLEALVDVVRVHAGGRRRLRAQGAGRRLLVGLPALARRHRPGARGDGARRGRAHPGRGLQLLPRPREDDRGPAPGSIVPAGVTRAPSVLSLALPALVVLAAEPLYLLVDTAVVGHLGTVALGGLAVGGGLLAWAAALLNFLAYGTTARAARRAGAGDRAGAVAEGVQATWLALGLGLVVLVLFQLLAGPADPRCSRAAPGRSPRRGRSGCGSPALGRAAAAGLAGRQRLAARRAGAAAPGALRAGREPGQPGALPAAGPSGRAGAGRLGGRQRGRPGGGRRPVPPGAAPRGRLLAARGRPPSGPSWSSAATCSCAPRCSSCPSWSLPGWPPAPARPQLGAHQIALQLFFFLALVLDAYAIAAQTLVGHALGGNRPDDARATARRVVLWGLGTGLVVAAVLLALRDVLPAAVHPRPRRPRAGRVVWWFLAGMQPLAGVVFALDGVLMGAGDVGYLRTVTIGSARGRLPAAVAARRPLRWGLAGVWTGLCLFIGLRLAGVRGAPASARRRGAAR